MISFKYKCKGLNIATIGQPYQALFKWSNITNELVNCNFSIQCTELQTEQAATVKLVQT